MTLVDGKYCIESIQSWRYSFQSIIGVMAARGMLENPGKVFERKLYYTKHILLMCLI